MHLDVGSQSKAQRTAHTHLTGRMGVGGEGGRVGGGGVYTHASDRGGWLLCAAYVIKARRQLKGCEKASGTEDICRL